MQIHKVKLRLVTNSEYYVDSTSSGTNAILEDMMKEFLGCTPPETIQLAKTELRPYFRSKVGTNECQI